MHKNNLKKIDIIKNFSSKTGFSINLSKRIIENLILCLKSEIKKGNMNLKNIGSFKTINKNERIGRNPKTKEKYLISSRKSISFTVSKQLSEDLKKIL